VKISYSKVKVVTFIYPNCGNKEIPMETERDPLEDLSFENLPPNLLEEEPKESSGDISKNAILVLLVLTIFVSAAGTWIVLKATENIKLSPQLQPSSPSTGQVVVQINTPAKTSGTGYATVNIQRREEN